MKQWSIEKQLQKQTYADQAGYGAGFWTLMAGFAVGFGLLVHLELKSEKNRIVVESISSELNPANAQMAATDQMAHADRVAHANIPARNRSPSAKQPQKRVIR
jgi:hypothetical protein